MQLELIRTNKKEWGIDGMLRVNGEKFCDTVEHPTLHKPAGLYVITRKGHPFRHGDGPMLSQNGEIIVGTNACPGMVIHSAAAYQRLYESLRKAWQRGHTITLKIR